MPVTRIVALTRPRITNERRGGISDMFDRGLVDSLMVVLQCGQEIDGLVVSITVVL